MTKKYDTSLFIFRRDLRIIDNTALIQASKESKKVIPLFICTPSQLSDKNKYRSSNSIQFMIESLYDLDSSISDVDGKLIVTYGDEIPILKKILKSHSYEAIYINEDYTPYAIKRDKSIKNFCKDSNIKLHKYTDILLTDCLELRTLSSDKPYNVFGQFYKRAQELDIPKPNRYNIDNLSSFKISGWNIKSIDKYLLNKEYYEINENISVDGGRNSAKKILKNKNKKKKKIKKKLKIKSFFGWPGAFQHQ